MACSTPGIGEMGDAVGKKETSSNQLRMPASKSGLLPLTLQARTVFIIFKPIENNYKHVYSYQETDFSRYQSKRIIHFSF